jgi:hypothetical protein
MLISIIFKHLMLSLSKHELAGRRLTLRHAEGEDFIGGLKNAE